MALLLALLSLPQFDGREKLSSRSRRAVHATWSALMFVMPLTLLPAWKIVLLVREPQALAPNAGLLSGNLILFSTICWFCILLFGEAMGAAGALVLMAAFFVSQQVWPGGVMTELFSTGRDWHIVWPVPTVLVLCAIAFFIHSASVPVRSFR